MSIRDRILLLITGLLAAYQIVVGIDHMGTGPICAYTVAFGVLLLAGLLLIILGFEVLDSPIVVIAATLIPLSLSTGLIWQYLPNWRNYYLIFAGAGMVGIILTRSLPMPGRLPVLFLALVHGVAGLLITFLPLHLVLREVTPAGFALVGLGGALIGLGGLLLAFLKAGQPILSKQNILKILPGLLLLMTAAFVGGFSFG
ncbi:MAG: hypothetical protein R6V73_12665 [Anaerolineales bacterium]